MEEDDDYCVVFGNLNSIKLTVSHRFLYSCHQANAEMLYGENIDFFKKYSDH